MGLLRMFPQFEIPLPIAQIDVGTLLNFLFVILFFVFMVWGQRIQNFITLRDIELAMNRLGLMRDGAKKVTLEKFKKHTPEADPGPFVDKVMEYVTIEPVSLDPAGIVPKWDHLLKTTDFRIRSEVEKLATKASPTERENLSMVLEVSSNLNLLYKIVKHYYILGKKTGNPIVIMQLQYILPDVLMQADALMGALYAFSYGHPVGDGIAEVVAAQLIYPKEGQDIAQDTVYVENEIQGRNVTILKAKGPGGTVGYPGDAAQAIMSQRNFDLVLMVDAGLKLEGEKSGTIAEGTGAAIGGIGTEKFKIEEEVTKKGTKLYAIIIKMSLKEAITPLTEDLFKSTQRAVEIIKQTIVEKVPEGGNVLVIGIGNTIGVR